MDKWGIPFFHRSKKGGFFYQMSSSPENDTKYVDWPDEMSFPGSDTAVMEPNGPTDFGIGKNIAGFGSGGSESIGGCGMNFADTADRGYAYKKDDVRDLEYKCVVDVDGFSSGNGFSISACTGRHSSKGCCQGFAYMGTVEVTENPSSFRFRKEMWHVNYDDSPEGSFTHSKFNFKIDGHGPVGLGFCRYNKRKDPTKDDGPNDQIILEYWGNPTPSDNSKWVMLKRITDQKGNGWGDGGDDCHGAKDQHGPWSNAQNRMKTNSTNGTATFTKVSFREIDEFSYYSTDSPGGGDPGTDPGPGPATPPPPPPTGSGTLQKNFRDFFNINTSPEQSCSGISAGVLPFVNVYSETLGTSERKILDIAVEANRTRAAVRCVNASSQLLGKKPRRFIIPMKKLGSPGGNVRCVIWDAATSPEGGNEVVVMGTVACSTITTEYTDITFYNEAAPLSLPQGMRVDYRIGVEYLGTSDTDWVTVKYNGDDPVNGGNTMNSMYQITAPDPKKWIDYANRDLTCRIET